MKRGKKPAKRAGSRGVQPSENAYALAALGKRLTFATIAKRIGQSEASVRHYATGRRVPGEIEQLRLHEAYALPLVGWTAQDAPGRAAGGRTAKTSTYEAIVSAGPPSEAPTALLARYRSLAATLEGALVRASADKDSSPRDAAALAQALSRALQHIGRLTGEGEITEAMIVKAPTFAKVLDAIREVGRRHPEAGRELFEALAKFEGGAS